MNRSQLFEIWAPPASKWSVWAKPVLFAEMPLEVAPMSAPTQNENVPGLVSLRGEGSTALVIDLPGVEAVRAGVQLATQGFQPVPLFNSAFHANGVVDTVSLAREIVVTTPLLEQNPVPPGAPPVFLLDASRKLGWRSAAPGTFDNRWVVFPQDFPSANFLKGQGVTRVVLITKDPVSQPAEDLAHVLVRWQESGIEILSLPLNPPAEPTLLQVTKPSGFRSLFYQFLVLTGLRRSSAGGFGGIVPNPSSGG
jgi:hypothetical protein